jgi:NAD(P)-dependent dehydrogenase (short-subunit alcohol dehydrogenase family)
MPWTPSDIPDLTGKTAIVTGANSGLGFHASAHLAARGAQVLMACRDEGRALEALAAVRSKAPGAKVSTARLDLADLDSVRSFADQAPQSIGPVDLLVNNAGVMAVPRRESAQGYELQLATNHLGHFALTGLLLSSLTAHARVVTVASQAHRQGTLHKDDLMLKNNYSPFGSYGQSKLANLLFTSELHRRLEVVGSQIRALAAHPGLAATELMANGMGSANPRWITAIINSVMSLVAQSADQGSWPELRAATDPQAQGGAYYGPKGIGQWRGTPVPVDRSKAAQSAEDAVWLWERSVELTGVGYVELKR